MKTLAEMSRITGGAERTAWDDVFNASRLRDRQVRDLVFPLALMVLLLHLTEIGGRRLLLFAAAQARLRNLRIPRRRRRTVVPPLEPAPTISAGRETPTAAEPRPSPLPRPAVSPLARAKARARNRTKQ